MLSKYAIMNLSKCSPQAAIKRLQLNSFTGGQELVFKIIQSCSYLTSKNISINFYWVPSHLGIYGNEIVDKLAKKGLFRRKIQSSYVSLSHIERLAKEKILEQWKTIGNRTKIKENTILGSAKEIILFLLKPLRTNILKNCNQPFSN